MIEILTESPVRESVPSHWRRATIADTGLYVNGVAFKGSDWHDNGLPIIRIQNLTDPDKPFNYTRNNVREESRVYDGDILVSWSATLDAFRWRRGPAVLNQHIFKVFPNRELVRDDFLFYLLKEAIAEMAQSAHAHGSTMKHINRGPFLAHEVFIPPLDEQQEIVDEIETQFARLDDAVAALQRARTRLRRYRASVLKAACEGRLVPTEAELARQEGRDYEPASVLLDRIKAEREAAPKGKRQKSKKVPPLDTSTLPELPEGWVWTTLSDLLALPLSNGRSVPTADVGFPVLRLTALVNGTIDLKERKVGDWREEEASHFLVAGGDFLISRGNGSLKLVGRGGLVPENPDRVAFPDTLIRVRPITPAVVPRFLASVWNSALVRDQIEQAARTTAGIYKVNQTDLSNVRLPLPPLAEQEQVVAEVERRLSVIDQIETTIEANLKRAEALRHSILRKAFSGRLIVSAAGTH